MNWSQYKNSLRWVLFVAALVAVFSVTALNIYSLMALHEQTISDIEKNRENQLIELTNQTRSRFLQVVRELWKLDIEVLEPELRNKTIPEKLRETIVLSATDSLYKDIYLIYPEEAVCESDAEVFLFDESNARFSVVPEYPDLLCDGLAMARTRMKLLVQDYQWNTKLFFDTHRSMTVALIDNEAHDVLAYLVYLVDTDYLIHDYITPLLEAHCDTDGDTGMTLWLHDWTKNEILATNDPSYPFDRQEIQIIQRFPQGLMDNWNIKAVFDETPTLQASQRSLIRNLAVLGGAVLLLVGSLVVIWIIAQRERELATRQAGFLANVTHELKTPLAVMQAAGENLADGRVSDPERLKTYGKHIFNESVRLKGMIEKLLDVARSDSGQQVAKVAPFSLGQIVESWVDEQQAYLEQKGARLDVHIKNKDILSMVDKEHVRTILSNLVENAIKYSPNEKYVRIEVQSDGEKNCFSVGDRGRGIPQKALKHIFTKFYRVEDTLTAQTKGHGLGLSIVESLVTLNGGKIDVTSQLGKGSVFTISFPTFLGIDSNEKMADQKEERANYVVQG